MPSLPGPRKKTIMRSLGEFFGHIAHGVRTTPADSAQTPPSPPPPFQVSRQTVQEQHVETALGPVKLRRTVIDEVELPPNPPQS